MKTSAWQTLEKDPRTRMALENCEELADCAIYDLNRSYKKFGVFDMHHMGHWITDMQIWLSGAVTYQETCLDGFEDTSGDAGNRMRMALNASMKLTSNALAMITKLSSLFPSHGNELLPDWIDAGRHMLLSSKANEINPDLTVAKDGTGKYKTIMEALKDIPKNKYNDATISAVKGDYFMAKDIGFENRAGPEKHQAVALRVGADKPIFYNCHMDGYQDTQYAHTYRQFYGDCVISGTIDFIFGDSAAVFQNCTLVVRKPMENQQCIVTAQGWKDPQQPTEFVLQNCKFVADREDTDIKSYLGRPLKEYSQSRPWGGRGGPASSKTQRVKWEGVKELPASRIERFTSSKFIDGDSWIPSTGIPYSSDLFFPPPKEDASVP
ncbi:hypothetical protein RND71_035371 [Anisodus tanguticus]|uniref:Pectinesterase n=1 Tax=Anisodus tanguticus TaxID=243964 RepID=A0AAE1R4S8_9SOLA|nr:hypothetical protein RND71_035371 [Anisodus tanguticus]